MATLARNPLSPRFSPRARAATGARSEQAKGGVPTRMLFVVGSVGLHALLLTFMSSAPESAHAAPARELDIELIELAPSGQDEVATPEPEPMPLGKLEAPFEAAPVKEPLQAVPIATPPSDDSAPQSQTAEAPEIVTALNPYASSSTAAFTSGSSTSANTKVVRTLAPVSKSTASSFGVENGSSEASLEAKKKLQAWYAKVRAQLARVGARAYPRRAQKLGQQGTTKITVKVGDSGALLASSVSSGSGFTALDQAALQGIRSVGAVPAPPAGAGGTSLTVPITFRLN